MPKTKNPDSRSWLNKVAAKRPMKALNWANWGLLQMLLMMKKFISIFNVRYLNQTSYDY